MRWVQRIAASVHDEERLVPQVVREQRAVDALLSQHEQRSVQRKKRRIRRRVAHRHVEGAGRAVGDAGDDHAVLVDVVGALDGIENRAQVLDLLGAPPGRLVPTHGHHVDLLRPGQPADRSARARRRIGAHHAAVQLDAHLIGRAPDRR